MSERLPYELQLPHQWEALPLPDENLAWADMKRRLEDDDDRKPLFWWQRGCMLWGFLLLSMLGIGWWIFRPDKWITGKSNKETIGRVERENDGSSTNNFSNRMVDTPQEAEKKSNLPVTNEVGGTPPAKDTLSAEKGSTPGIVLKKDKAGNNEFKRRTQQADNRTNPKDSTKRTGWKNSLIAAKDPVKKEKGKIPGAEPVSVDSIPDHSKDSVIAIKVVPTPDSPNLVEKRGLVKKDDPKSDTAAVNKDQKKDSTKRNSYFWSAGIALHQQLPVAGQKFTPYNSLGRKGSLGDYVPSVYLRLNRKEKWFLQAEFRYGAPQYSKEFVYDQQSVIDTGQNPVFTTITSTRLKKIFYHQLPLTFQYYLAKNWSFGGGIQWNFFSSAIAEQEINKRRNANGQDSIISKMITAEKDSAYQFTKNYFLGVVETEYQWKRFSIGARYTFGLQPYIRFSLPNGPAQQQKSTSLQIFLRYQLWRSGE